MFFKPSLRTLSPMHCLFPCSESFFATLPSAEPQSLSFIKTRKENEVNKGRKGMC